MLKLILSFSFRKRIAAYALFTFSLFLLQTPVLTLSENIFKGEVVSPVSRSAKTLVKIITPTPTPEPTLTPTPTQKPLPTNTPVPTATLAPTEIPQPEAIGGVGDEVWERLAACESNGAWNLNTGNGYFGGLQFSQGAWNSVGGQGLPSDASREEQIERGKMLKDLRGWGVWGLCAQNLGLN